jgi:hypothetical protein
MDPAFTAEGGRGGEAPGRALLARLRDPPWAVVIALCAGILSLRRAEAVTNPQFWAEDVNFYSEARLYGWHAFLRPLAGYLHMVARAIAAIAARVDPAYAPAVFVCGAALATLYVSGRTLSRRCPLPRFCGLFALAVVLVPDTHEVLLNLVNLQWVLAAGLVLLLISEDPKDGLEWTHDALAGLALGLTGPFCVILSPLFVARAAGRKSRASVALAAMIVGCAVIQESLVLAAARTVVDPPLNTVPFADILPLIGRRIGGSVVLGSLLSGDTDQVIGAVAGVGTLAGIGFLALRPGPHRRERVVLGLVFAVLLASVLYRVRYTLGLFFVPHTRARYVYLPHLIAIWLLLLNTLQGGRVARICAVLLALGLLLNLPTYREAAYEDMHWASYAARIRAGEAVSVPTNPPGWFLVLPARDK